MQALDFRLPVTACISFWWLWLEIKQLPVLFVVHVEELGGKKIVRFMPVFRLTWADMQIPDRSRREP